MAGDSIDSVGRWFELYQTRLPDGRTIGLFGEEVTPEGIQYTRRWVISGIYDTDRCPFIVEHGIRFDLRTDHPLRNQINLQYEVCPSVLVEWGIDVSEFWEGDYVEYVTRVLKRDEFMESGEPTEYSENYSTSLPQIVVSMKKIQSEDIWRVAVRVIGETEAIMSHK